MKSCPRLLLAVVLLAGGAWVASRPQAHGQTAGAPAVTPADYLRWQTEFKNWGRWGANDERGTTNLITAAKSLRAAKLVKTGIVISLAHAVPQVADAEIPPRSVFHRTTEGIFPTGTVDNYQVSYHGRGMSHMDSFCHFFGADGKMYNGYPASENLTAETGCKKDSVMAWRDGIVTRAVLYDMPQLKGVDWIEPGTPITRADLEAWEQKSGVKVGPGDIILLYVGRWKQRAAKGAPTDSSVAGYFADVIPWIKEREPAFIGHDFTIDWSPRPGWGAAQGIPVNPIHQAVLNWMGVNIIENLDLEQAVETARRLKRYEFMLTFAPLPVEGGTGSPLNPLAVF
ncbi:MAG: cyclase family protein [Candidatus Acidiferrales bacterium]